MAVKLDRGTTSSPENHEINVTPFIDVMLVLLIIFMVAAPLATVDMPVDLPVSPPSRSRARKAGVPHGAGRSVARARQDGRWRATGWQPRSTRRPPATTNSASSCAPTRAVPYGELMQAMNALRAAGYLKVALVGLEQWGRACAGSAASCWCWRRTRRPWARRSVGARRRRPYSPPPAAVMLDWRRCRRRPRRPRTMRRRRPTCARRCPSRRSRRRSISSR